MPPKTTDMDIFNPVLYRIQIGKIFVDEQASVPMIQASIDYANLLRKKTRTRSSITSASQIGQPSIFFAPNEEMPSSCLHAIFGSAFTLADLSYLLGECQLADLIDRRLGEYRYLNLVDIFRNEFLSPVPYDVIVHQSPPAIDSQEFNKYWSEHCSHTFWLSIFKSVPLLPLITHCSSHALVEPFISLCLPRDVGSMIIYVYAYEDILVCPIYSGLMVEFCGLLIADLSSSHAAVVASGCLTPRIRGSESTISEIVDVLNASLSKFSTKSDPTCSRGPLKKTLLTGMHRNYGHTVMNDSYCIDPDLINKLLAGNDVSITLGIFDYIDSEYHIGLHSTVPKHRFRSIESDRFGFFFGSTEYYYCPLPSHRPTTGSLATLSRERVIRSSNLADDYIYVSVDQRLGSRRLLNPDEVYKCLFDYVVMNGIGLVLDGMTSHPIYPMNSLGEYHRQCKQQLIEYTSVLRNRAEQLGIRVITIDGMTLPDKVLALTKINIKHAFVPYGSGAITPIYLLNTRLAIFGSSFLDRKTRNGWSWHMTSLCHPLRFFNEDYLPSSWQDDSGYSVDVMYLTKYLAEL